MILARSPYIVHFDDSGLEDIEYELYIYRGTQTTDRGTAKYTFAIDAINEEITFDISPYIMDYFNLETTVNYSTSAQDVLWVGQRVRKDTGAGLGSWAFIGTDQIASMGYHYPEEEVNFDASDRITAKFMTDKPYLYEPLANGLYPAVPYYAPKTTSDTIRLWSGYNGTGTADGAGESITYPATESAQIFRKATPGVSDNGAWKSMAVEIPKNTISKYINIKYFNIGVTPYRRIIFINRYGMRDYIWFYGKEVETNIVSGDSYKKSILNSGTYKNYNRQEEVYRKSGKRTLLLNSGWYPEGFNEIFRQLLLSQYVWISEQNEDGGFTIYNDPTPYNLITNSISYKTILNDKLISYDMEFSFANDLISTIK